MVLDAFLTPSWFRALRDEGLARRAEAREQRQGNPGGEARAGGNPDRYLASAESGPVLEQIYLDAAMIARLETLAGRRLKPTGSRGSFSYYDREGHFLGLHRDIRSCDLTMITCLDRKDSARPSGALRLYPRAMRDELDHINATTPRRDIQMQPGQSVLLLGGCIPHEVLPADRGFSRSIAVLCFEMTARA